MFKLASKAYIRLTLLNIVTGLVALLIVYILNALNHPSAADVFNWIFFFLPNYSLGQSFSNIFTNYNNLRLYDELIDLCKKMFPPGTSCEEFVKRKIKSIESTSDLNFRYQKDYLAWDTPGIGRFLVILPIEGLVFMLLVLSIDYGVFRRLSTIFSRDVRVNPFDNLHQVFEEDSDVLEESRRVLEGDCRGDVLVVKDLTKTFKVPGTCT